MNYKEIIVVVGFGWVGQANAIALRSLGYRVFYYDPGNPTHHYVDRYASFYGQLERLSTVDAKDSEDTCYIVCVGDKVSEDGVQDISAIEAALDSLKLTKGSLVLRSTILPDRLGDLSFDVYLPEFLHEKKAVEECVDPYLLVIGRKTDVAMPSFLNLWKKQARKTFVGTPEEAAYIKYLSNAWNALRIAFVNEFGDTIAAPTDRQNVSSIEKIIDFLFDKRGYMRYGRSYGGHCLPKDTRAFFTWYKQKGHTVSVLEGAHMSNAAHQVIEFQNPHLPEWFSEWPTKHMSGKAAFRELLYAIRKKLKLV